MEFRLYLCSVGIGALPWLGVVVPADARPEPLVGVARHALHSQTHRVPLGHRAVRQEHVGVGLEWLSGILTMYESYIVKWHGKEYSGSVA